MFTDLPYTLTVGNEEKEIYPDFRNIVLICNAFNDPDLTQSEKTRVMLELLYVEDWWTFSNIEEAAKQAIWFIDWGKEYKEKENGPRVLDWEQDYNIIIAAVDKSVKTVESCLELPFMHWWTFLAKFSERGECQFSTIADIRDKLNKGKKLEKHEKQILRENRGQIILKNKANHEFEDDLWGGE